MSEEAHNRPYDKSQSGGTVEGSWWREHPAYADLMESFTGCNNTQHLAFLALTGLRQRGWEIDHG